MLDAVQMPPLGRPIAETDGDATALGSNGAANLRRHPDDVARIAQLEALVAARAAALAHGRKVFERASAVARIGVWECSLSGETLTWSDGVYGLLDLPRGSPTDRATTQIGGPSSMAMTGDS